MRTNKYIQFWSILLVFLTVFGIGNAWGAYTALSLPASWTAKEGRDAYTADKGCQWSLGTDYSSSGTYLKFNEEDCYLTIKLADAPEQLSYSIKSNSFSGGTFKVQQSPDSVTFTNVAVYTSISDGSKNHTLAHNTRYIRFIYTYKKTGNVGLGTIAITKCTTTRTVTFNKQGGIFDDDSEFTRTTPSYQIDEASNGAGITLPSISPSSACAAEGWGFCGWSTAAVASETTTIPTTIVGKAGDKYYPSANTPLHAVFVKGEYTKETTSITDDAKYLIVANSGGKNYILKYSNVDIGGYTGVEAAQIDETSDGKYDASTVIPNWMYTFDNTSSSYYIRDVISTAASNYVDFTYGSNWYGFTSSSADPCTFSVSAGVWNIVSDYDSETYLGFDATDKAFFAYESAKDILLYKAGTITYYSTPSCCDKAVALSYNSAGSANVSAMSFSETSLATCSSTAGDREVTITVTPSTGYLFKSGDELTWTKSSGTIPSDPTKVSGPTLSAGKYVFVYRFAQNDNGAGTFAATASTYTNYRTVCSATYDIELNKNGGDADGSATVASNGTQLKNISAPTKTGYKVAGYYAESGKTNLVAAADGTLEKDVEISSTDWTNSDGEWIKGSGATLYAKWEAISYSVRFNKNNESATGTMSNESYDYDESKKLTDNAFSLTGYTFAGWATTSDGDVEYDDKESVSNLSSTDGAVVDLYAVWTANKYTLTLSASGETSSVGSQTVQATYGSSMPLKTTADGTPAVVDPSKTGYTFDGWEYNSTQYYSYDAGEDEISSAHDWDVADNVTLTPRWNINSYTLTWDLDGGTVTEAGTGAAVDATGTPSSSVNYGASITAPTVTKAGYTFAGWDVTPASTMPASNTTYTATWTEKTVTGWTWTNHRGGATITSDPIVIYVGQKVQLDIAYLPADVLSTHTVKENYDYTRSDGDSYLKYVSKASAYFTFSGKAAKSSTSITFTHTEDTSDPKAFAKTVNVEVRALPTDTYLDLVHGVSFSGPYGATLIDSDYGVQFTYTAPGGDVSDWSSSYANTCEQYHVHLIGWVESSWADEHLGDAVMPNTAAITSSGYYHPVGETMTVSGKTYYAVWAKVE